MPTLITRVIYLLYNCYVPASCEIGEGTKLGYGGIALVIHARARIGRNCVVGSCVTIGGRSGRLKVPVVGDNVYIGTGARVLGDIVIGDNVTIGANAVVISDVPAGSIAVGVPARVIENKAIEVHARLAASID